MRWTLLNYMSENLLFPDYTCMAAVGRENMTDEYGTANVIKICAK